MPLAITVAVLALALGSVGTAVAGPALTKGKVKAIATKVVKKQAPSLSVAKAAAVQDGAINGASVADGSLGAADLAVGVVPADGYLFQAMSGGLDPVAAPDSKPTSQVFTLPRAGTAYVRMFGAQFSVSCSSGPGVGGLYIDGAAIPGTGRSMPASGSETAIELLATPALTQGAHTLAYGVDCSTGTYVGSSFINATWTVMLTAE